jgi:hypothetical protein
MHVLCDKLSSTEIVLWVESTSEVVVACAIRMSKGARHKTVILMSYENRAHRIF